MRERLTLSVAEKLPFQNSEQSDTSKNFPQEAKSETFPYFEKSNNPYAFLKNIIETYDALEKSGNEQALYDYGVAIGEQYFSTSEDVFDGLPLKDHFQMLQEINARRWLRGPIGQSGTLGLVYRLNWSTKSPEELPVFTKKFINELLEGKDISDIPAILLQIKTIAANALASGWAHKLYEAFCEYFKTEDKSESFFLTQFKKSIFYDLQEEQKNPSIGIVTTADNEHPALMFEHPANTLPNSDQINSAIAFHSLKEKPRLISLSTDYIGLMDTRNNLTHIVSKATIESALQTSHQKDAGKQASERNASRVPVTPIDLSNKTLPETIAFIEKNVNLFKAIQSPRFRASVEEVFGIPLDTFDLKTQSSVITFLSQQREHEVIELATDIREFYNTNEERKNAFIVLLSNERFGGTRLIEMLSWYNAVPEVSIPLYKKYAEIVSEIDQVEAFLSAEYKSTYEQTLIDNIKDSLFKEANQILAKHYAKIVGLANAKATAAVLQGKSILPKEERNTLKTTSFYPAKAGEDSSLKNFYEKYSGEILSDLEKISKENLIFLTSFKTLKKNNEPFLLEEFNNIEWQSAIAPEDIAPDNREAMRKIYANNYPSPQYSQAFREELLRGFEERFRNPDCRFYLLKHKNGDIIGFNAYTDTETDAENRQHTYFGAFNINPAYGQSKLGEAMLDATLETEGKDHIIEAHCDSRTTISAKYIESGFVATACEDISGAPSFSIKRDLALNDQLITKRTIDTLTPDAIEALIQKGSPREYIRAIKLSAQEAFPKKYFDAGFVLTRYLFLENGTRYAVFEKPSSKNTPATT